MFDVDLEQLSTEELVELSHLLDDLLLDEQEKIEQRR